MVKIGQGEAESDFYDSELVGRTMLEIRVQL